MQVWNFDQRIFSVYAWAWDLISIFGSQWITSAGTDVEENHLGSPPVSQPGLLKQQLLFLHLLFLAQDKNGQGYCGIPLFVGDRWSMISWVSHTQKVCTHE